MKKPLLAAALLIGMGASLGALAQATGVTDGMNMNAIAMFLAFVMVSLWITYWAAGRVKSTSDFYTAGGQISGFQNGLAITGDWCSSAALMGIAGLIYTTGFDGLIYSVIPFGAWPLMMFLLADRLRNLGKFTIADIVSVRMARVPIRSLIASAGLAFVVGYLIVQMVGAGTLISSLFGLKYEYAQVIIGFLIIVYVAFGGMVATTYVQLIKAVLLLSGASFITFAVLAKFGFSPEGLYEAAVTNHPTAEKVMQPGGLLSDPINAISCGVMLLFGGAAMPHVLMRFFTVPDAKEARRSVAWAATFIGYFYLLTFVIGYGAVVFVMKDPQFLDAAGVIKGGANMAAIHLAEAMGGDLLLGFISAVAFATIVAVVAGLTIAGASAISHDLYANILRHGRASDAEVMKVSRFASIGLGILGIILGIAFKEENIAYLIVLPFTISSTVFFPVLFLAMYWRRLTTTGIVVGGWLGLASAVVMLVVGPTIWKDILGHAAPIFPYKYPALFSMAISSVTMIVVSLLDNSARARAEVAAFDDQFVRSQTGLGAEGAARH
ncbi:MAG: cation/acetate symporter ActP [Gammaproteobacteria bacterium]|nr:cation/acetate symporter ActP [Gammaproteobacteria bacterium]